MQKKFTFFIIVICVSFRLFSQETSHDSLLRQKVILQTELNRLDSLLDILKRDCNDYTVCEVPPWLKKVEVYYAFNKSCKKSSSYLLFLKDGRYILRYFGEGFWNKEIDFGKYRLVNKKKYRLVSQKHYNTMWIKPASKNGVSPPCRKKEYFRVTEYKLEKRVLKALD